MNAILYSSFSKHNNHDVAYTPDQNCHLHFHLRMYNLAVRYVDLLSISLLQILLQLCISHVVHAGQVVDLTSENFNHLSSTHELVFINFYADWCRFSQILTPIFEEAYVKTLKEFGTPGRVLFAKVDCEKETDLATRFHISKYPTLKLLMNGKQMKKEYRGQRSIEAIVNHVKEILKDPVKSLVTFNDFEAVDQKKAAIIGYFQVLPGATPDYTTFRKVATDLREDCNFYWVTGEPTVIQLRDGVDHRITFKPTRSKPQEKDLVYPGAASSYDELSTWATDKCIPLVREITFENAEELTEEGLPFLILFHKPDDKKSVEDYTEIIHKELYTETASVNFLTADGLKFAHPLHHLGKTQQDLPLIAIDSFRHMYLFPNFGDLRYVEGLLYLHTLFLNYLFISVFLES